MATLGNGVYAGGYFTSADGSSGVNAIAKWDGFSWSRMGTGMQGTVQNAVYGLAASGTNLFASGFFLSAGGVGTGPLARWNGSSWSALPALTTTNGYHPAVYALAATGSELYAGGEFIRAGGVVANRIAKWDGTGWSGLGSGMDTNVRAIALSGSDLYAGGEFTNAGGKAAAYIAHAYLPPALSIRRSGLGVTVSWPSPGNAGLVLEQAESTEPGANWVARSGDVADDNTNRSVTIPTTNSVQFFRLRRP